ncbi:hypothetical protein DOY81_000105 [Sarcophaga bullata]|nr:hypothetical protein DOY81_000105 [Sarcophaga bullata]
MENANSALLPHILESLNRKPECCDTYENLQNEIKIIFSDDKLGNRLCKALDKAIDVGQSLGVIQITDDLVRIPFSYNRGTACPRAITMVNEPKAEEAPIESVENVVTQPRRTHTVKPNIISPIHLRKRRRKSIGVRRRRRARRRR